MDAEVVKNVLERQQGLQTFTSLSRWPTQHSIARSSIHPAARRFNTPDAAVAQAEVLLAAGADILDVPPRGGVQSC